MLERVRGGLTDGVVNRDCRPNFSGLPEAVFTARRSSRSAESADSRLASLARAIEGEIIPRLMLAHQLPVVSPPRDVPLAGKTRAGKPLREDVFALARSLLTQDTEQVLEFLEARRVDGGMAPASLFLDLLAPAARHLGELWDDDLCDFVEVTLALGRLQKILRIFGAQFRGDGGAGARKVLLAPLPGEQHTFGLAMVAEFFRHAGWSVSGEGDASRLDLPATVQSEWFDAAGFSVGCAGRLDSLADCIASVRSASLNRRIAILVGGPIFLEHPELAAAVGADASTADARQAVIEAERLIGHRLIAQRPC